MSRHLNDKNTPSITMSSSLVFPLFFLSYNIFQKISQCTTYSDMTVQNGR